MRKDPMREAFFTKTWNQITSPVSPGLSEAAEELINRFRQAGFVSDDSESGDDDCIVIWPSRGLVGTTSVFPRLHNLQHRLEIVTMAAESAERRLAEAEEKYSKLPRSVAPDYQN